jgi:hypothetical protein
MHLLADIRSFWSFSVDVQLINFVWMLVDSFADALHTLRAIRDPNPSTATWAPEQERKEEIKRLETVHLQQKNMWSEEMWKRIWF